MLSHKFDRKKCPDEKLKYKAKIKKNAHFN